MIGRLLLISMVFTFVFARSIETNEMQIVPIHAEPRMDVDMNAEASNVVEHGQPDTLATPRDPIVSLDLTKHHPSHAHSENKDPKKRETIHRDDHETDPRPGCCG